MFEQLVNHSPDLQRLREEGYDIEIRSSHLLVKHVPYVTAEPSVQYGMLVSELSTSGNRTIAPATHEIFFVGSIPCDSKGAELKKIINRLGPIAIVGDLTASCSFSSKPSAGYSNYYDKVTAYVGMLEGHAQVLNPLAKARIYPPIAMDEKESVFKYLDSASSRAHIGAVTEKLALAKVVIVGLGGTGSYILDLVSKTPVREIHIYDGDFLYTHNAFRTPGAASIDELNEAPKKVHYFHAKYTAMHRKIFPHDTHVDATNIDELRDATFVFLSIDGGSAKKLIVERLEKFGIPFIDVGMSVWRKDDALGGLIRTTTSTPDCRSHIWDKHRISFADEGDDDYERNIQIADLNALNAILAVIKWKKLYGFYADFEREFSSTYTIDGNHLLNEDQKA